MASKEHWEGNQITSNPHHKHQPQTTRNMEMQKLSPKYLGAGASGGVRKYSSSFICF